MRPRVGRRIVIAFFLTLATSISAAAGAPEQEIDHLLEFVAGSPCTFIRNDVAYRGPEAAAHIEDKYEYYRNDIHTAEDFIDLAATRSALSGRKYLVHCGAGLKRPAADWLRDELAAFRLLQP